MSELERWEARFAAPGYHFGTEPNAFLKSKAGLLKPGQKALSIADGEGRNGVFLAEQGLDVLTMDFSPTALAKAHALAKDRGVTIRADGPEPYTKYRFMPPISSTHRCSAASSQTTWSHPCEVAWACATKAAA